MNVIKTRHDDNLVLAINGRIDTITSNQLSEEIDKAFEENFSTMVLDFSGVDYISSAGLRIVIITHKKAVSNGQKLELTNMTPNIKEMFDMTGFSKIFNVI